MTTKRNVWALETVRAGHDHPLLTSSGNWMSPWIFPNREQARKAARECREHQIEAWPVRIELEVRAVIKDRP